MIIEHLGKAPEVDSTAYIAPNAVLCGDVRIGKGARVLFGATLLAEGGPVTIGDEAIVMEGAVIRGSRKHPVSLGDNVLVGPRSYLTGCTIEDEVFLATGSTVFNGATVGARAEVRINGVVHVNSMLPPDGLVPIGWIAVGNPATVLPPHEHERIWDIQETLDFPGTVFGLDRPGKGESLMPELTTRYAAFLGQHLQDRILKRSD